MGTTHGLLLDPLSLKHPQVASSGVLHTILGAVDLHLSFTKWPLGIHSMRGPTLKRGRKGFGRPIIDINAMQCQLPCHFSFSLPADSPSGVISVNLKPARYTLQSRFYILSPRHPRHPYVPPLKPTLSLSVISFAGSPGYLPQSWWRRLRAP